MDIIRVNSEWKQNVPDMKWKVLCKKGPRIRRKRLRFRPSQPSRQGRLPALPPWNPLSWTHRLCEISSTCHLMVSTRSPSYQVSFFLKTPSKYLKLSLFRYLNGSEVDFKKITRLRFRSNKSWILKPWYLQRDGTGYAITCATFVDSRSRISVIQPRSGLPLRGRTSGDQLLWNQRTDERNQIRHPEAKTVKQVIINLAKHKDHPKKKWEKSPACGDNDDLFGNGPFNVSITSTGKTPPASTQVMTSTRQSIPVPEAMIHSIECQVILLEHIQKQQGRLNRCW